MSDEELVSTQSTRDGHVLIKPSAGGGGGDAGRLLPAERGALASAQRTAVAAFGDGTLLVERYVSAPRHIEIQVLADSTAT